MDNALSFYVVTNGDSDPIVIGTQIAHSEIVLRAFAEKEGIRIGEVENACQNSRATIIKRGVGIPSLSLEVKSSRVVLL